MSDVSVDISEWTKFDQDILTLAEETMPRETKKFMRREGGRAATHTRQKARAAVNKKTGNYFKSLKGTKAWKNYRGDYGVKVHAKSPIGRHAGFLEYGHKILIRGKYRPKHRDIMTRDFHIIEKGVKSFDGRFFTDCQTFVDQLVENGMRGK